MRKLGLPLETVDSPDTRARPKVLPVDGDQAVRFSAFDVTLVVGLLLLAAVLRRPWYMLSHPFWLDEAWVADSVRAPFSSLRLITSATPLGWTVLLRLIPPIGGPERYRLLPLLFSVAGVLPAYAIGRTVLPRTHLGGMVAAFAVAIFPDGLLHKALKPYTADAFMALLLWWLMARLEREWSRKRLGTLVFASGAGLLVSHTTAFVASSMFVALFLVNLRHGSRRRLRDVIVAGGVLALAFLIIYAGADRSGINPRLTSYWSRSFVPLHRGIGMAVDFMKDRGRAMLETLHVGPWWLALLLVLFGLATLWRRGQPALALVIPIETIEAILASARRLYPLWDHRTSLFLTTQLILVVAIGVSGAVLAFRRHALISVLGLFSFLVLLALGAWRNYGTPLPTEDVRGPVQYLSAHRQPGDSIVVSSLGAYSFAYYWQPDRPLFVPTETTAVTFSVIYGAGSRILVARDATDDLVMEALDKAAVQVTEGGRVWIVLSHVRRHERAVWLEGAQGLGKLITIPGFQGSLYLVNLGQP